MLPLVSSIRLRAGVLALLFATGCFTTRTVKQERQFHVETSPEGAAVYQARPDEPKAFVGNAPLDLTYHYEVKKKEFDSSCYYLNFAAIGAAVAVSGVVAGVNAAWGRFGPDNTNGYLDTGIAAAISLPGALLLANGACLYQSNMTFEDEVVSPPLMVEARHNDARSEPVALTAAHPTDVHLALDSRNLRSEPADVVALREKPRPAANPEPVTPPTSTASVATSAPPPPPVTAPPPAPASASASATAPTTKGFRGVTQPLAYVLAIGIEHYRDLPAAEGARSDAEEFARVAQKALGVPDSHVRLLLDERASRTDIEKQLQWLTKNLPKNAKLFFYFSGHGAPDAQSSSPFLMPYDADAEYIDSTGLAVPKVLEALHKTPATEVVAFLDSCFSGAGGRSVLPKGARPLVALKAVQLPPAGLAVFSAASGNQLSGRSADKASGAFTRYLVEGIESGESDIDGDGVLTLDELATWVAPRVRRDAMKSNREQTPVVSAGSGRSAAQFALGQEVK